MERKHQREMQKYLDQDGKTLEGKAEAYATAQFKFAKQLRQVNDEFSQSQRQSRITLEERLKSTHTGPSGMPV